MRKKLRKKLVVAIGSILLASLSMGGCISTAAWNAENLKAANVLLKEIVDSQMTQSELVMQVGLPTKKMSVPDGEIWVYELIGSEGVITTGQYGAYGYYSQNSQRYVDKSVVTIKFNYRGIMTEITLEGLLRGNFKFLRPKGGSVIDTWKTIG